MLYCQNFKNLHEIEKCLVLGCAGAPWIRQWCISLKYWSLQLNIPKIVEDLVLYSTTGEQAMGQHLSI